MRFLLLLSAAFAFSFGGLAMKASEGLTKLWPSVGVFGAFCLGAALQALGMRRAGMAITYVFVLGLEAITAFGLGAAFLGEQITSIQMAALALVIAGITLLQRPA